MTDLTQKLYWCSFGIFSFLESHAVYRLYKPIDNNEKSGGLLNRGNYKGWTQTIKESKAASNMLYFYGLWTANNKWMMTLLCGVIGISDLKTRLFGSVVMTFGCAAYFLKMNSLLKEMEVNDELNVKFASTVSTLIGAIFIPMWLFTTIVHANKYIKQYS